MLPRALTIAGSDSGGGAGIQADLKTFSALGVYGMSVITALTAQNTLGVKGVHLVPPSFVADQLDSVLSDLGTDAAKTGMLATAEIVEVVAAKIQEYQVDNLVIDPVMVAKSGDPLLAQEAQKTLVRQLLPLALIVTPNVPEAEVITGLKIQDLAGLREGARRIAARGPRWVVMKGGHLEGPATDIVFDGHDFYELPAERVPTKNTHGTGCTFSAAITAGLAAGKSPLEAIAQAKEYITGAIKHSLALGHGYGPTNHLYRWFR